MSRRFVLVVSIISMLSALGGYLVGTCLGAVTSASPTVQGQAISPGLGQVVILEVNGPAPDFITTKTTALIVKAAGSQADLVTISESNGAVATGIKTGVPHDETRSLLGPSWHYPNPQEPEPGQ